MKVTAELFDRDGHAMIMATVMAIEMVISMAQIEAQSQAVRIALYNA